MTADQLEQLSLPGRQAELVRGVLVVREPPGALHGYVALRLAVALAGYVDTHDLGAVFAAETGFKLFAQPDTVRAPDVAFVAKARLPRPLPVGYPALAPDLAIEVRSPSDQMPDVAAKVADWLAAGTRLVWLVDPATRTAYVHRADGTVATVAASGALLGEAVVPGFACHLAPLFPDR